MQEYTPNSYKYREDKKSGEERKKPEKVVTGTVKTRKKSEIQKFADVFISEDIQNVKSFVLMDVLVPAIKKAISDIVTNGIDMILYGSTGSGSRRSSTSKVSYRDYYDKREDRNSYDSSRSSGYNYDDVVLETRGEAEEVLDQLNALIETYGDATIADLYDLIGKTGPYTHNKYGWKNLHNAKIVRVRDGYLLSLPKAIPV